MFSKGTFHWVITVCHCNELYLYFLLFFSVEKPDSINDDDFEDEEQNEMDDEANKLAAEDAIKEGLVNFNFCIT